MAPPKTSPPKGEETGLPQRETQRPRPSAAPPAGRDPSFDRYRPAVEDGSIGLYLFVALVALGVLAVAYSFVQM